MGYKKSFYMVHVEGEGAPTHKHPCLESAKREAHRLMKVSNKEVYVLQAVRSVKPPMQYEETFFTESGDELPF